MTPSAGGHPDANVVDDPNPRGPGELIDDVDTPIVPGDIPDLNIPDENLPDDDMMPMQRRSLRDTNA